MLINGREIKDLRLCLRRTTDALAEAVTAAGDTDVANDAAVTVEAKDVAKMAAEAKAPAAAAEDASKAAHAKAVKVTGASIVVARQWDYNHNVRICVFRFALTSSFSVLLVLTKNNFFFYYFNNMF